MSLAADSHPPAGPSLASLPRGRQARVVAVGGERAFRRRLLEMGLVPGTAVHVAREAPFGGPIEVDVRGGRLSLRRAEAASVRVQLIDASSGARAPS